jgi:hypothetical protein
MDINLIADQIYNEKPKPKFTICLNLDINTHINEQFEIISLLLLNGIKKLLINEIYQNTNDTKKFKKYLLQKIILLKIYFASFGVCLNFSNVLKKDYNNFNFQNKVNFYIKNNYNFKFCILKLYQKKHQKSILYYNHIKQEKSIENMFIIVKFKNHFFKFSFNLLKK